jgi:hypothetical protein
MWGWSSTAKIFCGISFLLYPGTPSPVLVSARFLP